MNFSRLNLSEQKYQSERALPVEVVQEKAPIRKFHDWRKSIQEDHPYVEVFPSTNNDKEQNTSNKKVKKVKPNLV